MNKIIIGLTVVAALAVAWFILNPGDAFDYTVTVNDDVIALETELADLEAAVTAGTLTPAQATDAKVKIIARLDAINANAAASSRAELTPTQRAELNAGLDRLKNTLITYSATLAAVDSAAVEADVEAKVNRDGSYKKSTPLATIVADVIADVEESAEEAETEYEADAAVDAEIETVVEEAEVEAEIADDMDMSDDDTMMDDDTMSGDDGASMEMPSMEDPEADETSVEVDADAAIEMEVAS